MGVRFRRRVTIAPGVSLNISKRGLGISAGPRGVKAGIGPRGVHHSVGLPGTGLFYRKDASWGQTKSQGQQAATADVAVHVRDDGTVHFTDQAGQLLTPATERAAKTQIGPQVRKLLDDLCAQSAAEIHAILNIHETTPAPNQPLPYMATPFADKKPERPTPRTAGLLGALWPPHRRRIDAANEEQQRTYAREKQDWRTAKEQHEQRDAEAAARFNAARSGDAQEMERFLSDRLASLTWPRQTNASYEVTADGHTVHLDVDLPEVEDMPTEIHTAATRSLKLNTKTKSDTQIRREYMQHVHGVLFRVIGEVFHSLPTVNEVVASGFTQRPDPTTGAIRDDYILSSRCTRHAWQATGFANLHALDVIQAFDRFDTRRKVTKTGVFTPIEPHVSPGQAEETV
jgi:hypothetical protein